MCSQCKLVQLSHDYDNNYIYGYDYGYQSNINSIMKNHLKNVVRHSSKIISLKKVKVVIFLDVYEEYGKENDRKPPFHYK